MCIWIPEGLLKQRMLRPNPGTFDFEWVMDIRICVSRLDVMAHSTKKDKASELFQVQVQTGLQSEF